MVQLTEDGILKAKQTKRAHHVVINNASVVSLASTTISVRLISCFSKQNKCNKQTASRTGDSRVYVYIIFAGEVILQDKPLVCGPKNFHLVRQNCIFALMQPSKKRCAYFWNTPIGCPWLTRQVCLGCYRSVDGSFECPKCGWPMCGEECCGSEDHQPECRITQKYRPDKIRVEVRREEDKENRYDYMQCVTILRCLNLRDTQPVQWQDLLNLESHNPEREKLGLQNLERLVIIRFLREELHLSSDDYPDHLILKICGILFVNSFEVPTVGEGLQAVYGKVSLLVTWQTANSTIH